MIISHKHKFIFLHSRKCAGSSMEVALNNYLGPNDIQIGSWTESLRGNGKMNKKAIIDTFFSPLSMSNTLKQILFGKMFGKGVNFPRIVNVSKYLKCLYKDLVDMGLFFVLLKLELIILVSNQLYNYWFLNKIKDK